MFEIQYSLIPSKYQVAEDYTGLCYDSAEGIH